MGILQTIKREPVRALTAAAGVVPIVTTGLVLFHAWDPTDEQLAYVNGVPVALGVALGWTIVRNAVASKVNVERVDPVVADQLWPPPS